MIGTVKINDIEYRWIYSVRTTKMYQDRFGIPAETSEPTEAFLINLRFLYCCIKTSDELRTIDGQPTQLGNMGLGEFEALICDGNESAVVDFLVKFNELNEQNKKKAEAVKK
jgi:hypothetical protein